MIENYKKISENMKEKHKDWIFNNQKDILKISNNYNKLLSNLKKIEEDLTNFGGIIKKIDRSYKQAQGLSNAKGESTEKFKKLMKLNLSDLLRTKNDSKDALDMLATPLEKRSARLNSKFKDAFKVIAEDAQTKLQEKKQRKIKVNQINENLEELEIATLNMDFEKGIKSLEFLEKLKQGDVISFPSFGLLGKYIKLKDLFLDSMSSEKMGKKELFKVLDKLHELSLFEYAENLLFKRFGSILSEVRTLSIENAKNGGKSISNIENIDYVFREVFENFLELNQLLKTKYLFGRDEGANLNFGVWVVQEVNITLNEIFVSLDEFFFRNEGNVKKLVEKIEILVGEYNSKGISTEFVVEEFIES